ncbi:MAG TPA: TIGR01777 family oxidoreductase [Streptosporangiaceae bacterium]|nr:TIGR01777 family oxidoreductase [Streptosporangiaceae bacterium]
MRVAVTGASGLIGAVLATALRAGGDQVVTLVRRTPTSGDEIAWDPRTPRGGLAADALHGVEAVVHLAGAGVADRRWTDSYKEEIRSSRVLSTQAIAGLLAAMDHPPAVVLSGSAIGWYGDTQGREVDESAPAGSGFLAEVVRDWEAAADPAREAGIRVVTLRSGIVLTPRGGVLARMLPPFRLGLGARLGPGTQYMSWVTLADWIRAARFLIDHPEVSGPVNITTPNPETNAAFTAALAGALHRPALLSIPSPVLSVALGGVTSDLLTSARVLPRKLQEAGFTFAHPDLAGALAAELQSAGSAA